MYSAADLEQKLKSNRLSSSRKRLILVHCTNILVDAVLSGFLVDILVRYKVAEGTTGAIRLAQSVESERKI